MPQPSIASRRSAQALALSATATSLALSATVAWQRSPYWFDRAWGIASAALIVFGAHLLPAISARCTGLLRWSSYSLWLLCSLMVFYSHATLLLQAQARAGEMRAAALPMTPGPTATAFSPKRSRSDIAEKYAQAKGQLARVAAQRCSEPCAWLTARRAALTAQIDALTVEMEEARRWQAEQDRLSVLADRDRDRRDFARDDPVMTRLAALLGVPINRIDLVFAILFAIVIEGLACLCWYASIQGKPVPRSATPPVTVESPVVTHQARPIADDTGRNELIADDEPDVLRVRNAVDAGELRPTVAAIRSFLGCAQGRASHIRRLLYAPGASLPG